MDNILCRFIADRNTPILDNIKRYCISENKDELTVIGIVFYFLEGIKSQLDDNFVKECIADITKRADKNTKKVFSHFNAAQIRVLKGCEDVAQRTKASLKGIESGEGSITELMYFIINSNKTEWEKVIELEAMIGKAKDWVYMVLLTGLYTSKDSGIEIKYANHVGDVITYIYNRLDFVQDIEIVNAQYDNLVERQNINGGNEEKKEHRDPTREKAELIRGILKPSIIRNEKKIDLIFNYLESGRVVIQGVRDKGKTTGALCLEFYKFDIFKQKPAFTELLGILSNYWGVKKPAYDKPKKYENKLIELKEKHLFLDQGLV